MPRAKFDYPDLDVLDSPLMSSTPFASLSGIPGSAIAEKIFNDPDSWENDDADIEDVALGPIAWLGEEVEKFEAPNGQIILSKILDAPSSSRDTFPSPPANRASSIPPRGLDLPPCHPHSQAPAPQLLKPSEVPPPSYSRTESPAGSRLNSTFRSCERSDSRSEPPTRTFIENTSTHDSNGTARRRRLPSIPSDTSSFPPLRSSSIPLLTESPEATAQLQLSASRPPSSVRSILVGPVGPRTRSSSTQDTPRRGMMYH